jgi:hopanoid biosynthesis associated RND transporter like protein HpnN
MSAERMPPDETSFLSRPLGAAAAWVVRFPRATLAIAGALALACAIYSALGLGFRTSRLDLLNPKSSYNQLWLRYVEEFGDDDDAVVVLQGSSPDKLLPAIDRLQQTTSTQPQYFRSVLARVDSAKLRAKGLYYLSADDLDGIRNFIAPLEPVLAGQWSAIKPTNLVLQSANHWRQAAEDPGSDASAIAQQHVTRVVGGIAAALDTGEYRSPWPTMPRPTIGDLDTFGEPTSTAASHNTSNAAPASNESKPQYLLAEEGRLGFVLLKLNLASQAGQFDRGSKAIDELRRLIRETAAAHPDVKIGLTGLPIMENDEMRESASAMWQANVLSLVGVSLVVIACFGGIRHPLLAAAAFMLAMAWSFGFTTLAVGHLNILSAAFGAILIGIGMDFGIHYVARYVDLRNGGLDGGAALVGASRSVGPGIVTGGVTTAIAFFTVALTDFTGVVELGVISGGGVLLCIIAAMFVLPAMVRLVDRKPQFDHVPQPLPVDRWLAPLNKMPGTVFLGSLAVTAIVALGCYKLRYDHNLLNLQPAGLESVAIEKQLLAECDQSVWYAVSLCSSRAELVKKQRLLEKMPSVQRTEEIMTMLPDQLEAKQPIVADIHHRLTSLPRDLPLLPVDQPGDVDQALAQCEAMLSVSPQTIPTIQIVQNARQLLAGMDPRQAMPRISEYQQRSTGELLTRLSLLSASANPEVPSFKDFPQPLVDRFIGRTGKHQLRIYGHGSLWDMAALEKFVGDVKRVDPEATGKPLQTYYASRQMQRSYIHAACYALIAITIAILLDFGSLRDSLLALLPMALGVVQMFGMMGLFDIPLNAANMIVLPLLLGIGLDTGVHMVHDFRTQKGRYRVSSSTAVAVLITALTTTVGFGALMIAGHRGLQSLGRVMTIGATCCLCTSLVTLPALLTWLSRNRKPTSDDSSDKNGDEHNDKLVEANTTSAPAPLVPRPHFDARPTRERQYAEPIHFARRRTVE